MNKHIEKTSKILMEHNIKPSFQRIKILDYLIEKNNHPTVEDIYLSLHPEIPTLSKTTVYNTLHLFIEAGLIRTLNIENTESRYDPVINQHGHFKCDTCGDIYDFPVHFESMGSTHLDGFEVREKDIFLKGKCKKCKQH